MKEINFDDLPDDPNHPLIKQAARQKSMDISFDDLPEEKPKSFLSNVSQDLSNRLERQGEIYNATKAGEQHPIRGAWQTGTNVMGAANDIVGEGVKSLGEAAYNKLTTQGFKDRQKAGLESLAQTDAGKAFGSISAQMQMNKEAFKQQYPNWARDVEGLGEAGTFIMPGSTGSMLKGAIKAAPMVGKIAQTPLQVAKKVGQGSGEIIRDMTGQEKIIVPTPKEMKKVASNLYKTAETEGASLPSEFMRSFTDDIKGVNPQSDIAADLMGESAGTKLNQIFSKYADRPLDMKTIDEIDKSLTRKAQDSWKDHAPTNDTRDILEIQSRFRSAIKNSEPQKGLQSWNDAKSAFFASKQLEDIQDIFDHAKRMPQEATAIQTGARQLVESDRFRSFSPEAQKYLEKMASQSLSVDALKMMGSRLLPLIAGGSGSGVGTTAATAIGGMAARKGAAKVLTYQGNKAAEQVMKDYSRRSPKDIGKLPPREAQKILDEAR